MRSGFPRRESVLGVFILLLAWWILTFVLFFISQFSAPPHDTPPSPFAAAPRSASKAMFTYWEHNVPFMDYLKIPLTSNFVTFEHDAGGWNNMRMAFECFVLVAKLTGRILVLPPPARFYLLDGGPIKLFEKQGQSSSTYGDYFDIPALQRSGLRVISTQDFLELFPLDVQDDNVRNAALTRITHNSEHTAWFLHLRNLSQTFIWPTGPNQALNIPPALLFSSPQYFLNLPSHRIFHFPVHLSKNLRYLGGAPALLDQAAPSVKRFGYDFIKHHVHYSHKIMETAWDVLPILGGVGNFSCMHIRRNDLQFSSSFLQADISLRNVESRLSKEEIVYLATDEIDPTFFQAFTDKGYRVMKLRDVWDRADNSHVRKQRGISSKHEGMVEQFICAGARVFAGTSSSTFTSYIHRLRKYMWGTESLPGMDVHCLFHDKPESVNELSKNCRFAAGFARADSDFVPPYNRA